LIGTLLPRIVVVDISLDGGSGLELIKDVKAGHPKVDLIVCPCTTEMLYAERAMRAGGGWLCHETRCHRQGAGGDPARCSRAAFSARRQRQCWRKKLVQGPATSRRRSRL